MVSSVLRTYLLTAIFTVILFWPYSIQAESSSRYESDDSYQYSYSVPVSAELKPYATFVLSHSEWLVVNKRVRAVYSLPLSLVGKSISVVMEGEMSEKNDFFTLKGDQGDAHCLLSESQSPLCLVRFKQLEIDKAKVEDTIKRQFKQLGQLEKRLQVAKIFAQDPIGIITMKQIRR